MFTSTTELRVRYGETDQMGYVYYGNYALYYEQGRAEAIRALGVSYKNLEEIGIMMPVMEMSIRYLRPAMYDDLLTVETQIKTLSHDDLDITFHTSIYNMEGKRLNEGKIKLAFVDARDRKRTNIPTLLFEKLKTFF